MRSEKGASKPLGQYLSDIFRFSFSAGQNVHGEALRCLFSSSLTLYLGKSRWVLLRFPPGFSQLGRVIILKQNLDISQHNMHSKVIITLFSLFAELERDLISLRTKEALAAKKKQGVRLGKPKGTLQKSKFDADQERIKELLKLGLSVRKIAALLGYNNHLALNTYITKRQLREQSS